MPRTRTTATRRRETAASATTPAPTLLSVIQSPWYRALRYALAEWLIILLQGPAAFEHFRQGARELFSFLASPLAATFPDWCAAQVYGLTAALCWAGRVFPRSRWGQAIASLEHEYRELDHHRRNLLRLGHFFLFGLCLMYFRLSFADPMPPDPGAMIPGAVPPAVLVLALLGSLVAFGCSEMEWARRSLPLVLPSLATAIGIAMFGEVLDSWLWQPFAEVTLRLSQLTLTPFLKPLFVDGGLYRIGFPTYPLSLMHPPYTAVGHGALVLFGLFAFWALRAELRPRRFAAFTAGAFIALPVLGTLQIAALLFAAGFSIDLRQAIVTGPTALATRLTALTLAIAFLVGRHQWRVLRPTLARDRQDATLAFTLPWLLLLLTQAILPLVVWDPRAWLLPATAGGLALTFFAVQGRYELPEFRFDWRPLAVGAGVGLAGLWLLPRLDRGPGALALLAGAWVFPLVEELARAYCLRRWSSREWQSTRTKAPPEALLLGAFVTAIFSGNLVWSLGAGLAYGLVFRRRGRVGDSLLAHLAANSVLAAYAVATGRFLVY